MATLTNIVEHGVLPEWGDSLGQIYFDGKIQAAGQARRAIYNSNKHYVFTLSGQILHDIDMPSGAGTRAESNTSNLGGKFTVLGGIGNQDIWQFDPAIAGYTAGSWTQLVSDFKPNIGRREMAWGATVGSWFYIGGGWNNNTVYKTQNFTTWTLVGNLPTNIARVCACACCVFQGKIYVIGGATNVTDESVAGTYAGDVDGYVYSLDPATDTWTLVTQDKERFGQMWIDAAANSTAIYVSKGYISSSQILSYSGGSNAVYNNNRGLMRSTDGSTWTDMGLTDGLKFFYESHRRMMVTVGEDIYTIAGFAVNDMWKISE